MNLRLRFALVAFCAAAVPLCASFYVGGSQKEAEVDARVKASLDEATLMGTERLDDWFFTNKAAIKTMVAIPGLVSADPAVGKAEMRSFTRQLPWVRAAFTTTAEGFQDLRTDDLKPADSSDRTYYKAAMEKGLGRQVVVSRLTNRPTFLIAAPMAPESGAKGGVLGFALDLDKISMAIVGFGGESLSARKAGMFARAQRFIAMEDGKLLAHSRPGAVDEPKAGALADASGHPLWRARPRAGEVSYASYADAAGARWVGAMRQSSLGWYVGAEMSRDETDALLAEARARSVAGFVASLAAALALAWFGSGVAARLAGSGSQMRAWALAVVGLSAALPVAGYAGWELAGEAERAEAGAASILADAARRSAQKMDSWMEANRASIGALAATPRLWADAGQESSRALAKARLKLGISQLPWVRASYLIDADGMQILRSDEEKPVAVGDRKFFKQARVGAFGSQVVISRVTKLPGLIVAKAITDPEGKFLAEVAYAINADVVTENVAKDKVGRSGFKFVLEKEGGLVAHPRKDQSAVKGDELPVYVEHPLWKARPVGDEVSVARFERDGSRFLGAVAKAGDFYVAAVLPSEEVEESSRAARAEAVGWTLLAFVLALGAGFALSSAGRSRRA